jgi:hypothetical protein
VLASGTHRNPPSVVGVAFAVSRGHATSARGGRSVRPRR